MIVIDATPLQTEHRYRGIGTYTAGLLDALTEQPPAQGLGLLVQAGTADDHSLLADLLTRPGIETTPLHRPRWRRSRLQWLVQPLGIARALRHAGARIYHATVPERPDPRAKGCNCSNDL